MELDTLLSNLRFSNAGVAPMHAPHPAPPAPLFFPTPHTPGQKRELPLQEDVDPLNCKRAVVGYLRAPAPPLPAPVPEAPPLIAPDRWGLHVYEGRGHGDADGFGGAAPPAGAFAVKAARLPCVGLPWASGGGGGGGGGGAWRNPLPPPPASENMSGEPAGETEPEEPDDAPEEPDDAPAALPESLLRLYRGAPLFAQLQPPYHPLAIIPWEPPLFGGDDPWGRGGGQGAAGFCGDDPSAAAALAGLGAAPAPPFALLAGQSMAS
jgi:hypothetical protein